MSTVGQNTSVHRSSPSSPGPYCGSLPKQRGYCMALRNFPFPPSTTEWPLAAALPLSNKASAYHLPTDPLNHSIWQERGGAQHSTFSQGVHKQERIWLQQQSVFARGPSCSSLQQPTLEEWRETRFSSILNTHSGFFPSPSLSTSFCSFQAYRSWRWRYPSHFSSWRFPPHFFFLLKS